MTAGARGGGVLAEGVVKRLGQHVTALRGLDLAVSPGELLLLQASTLLNLVAGFDTPDAGRIVVAGQDLAGLDDPARFRRDIVGVVFQLHHLIAGLTAEDRIERIVDGRIAGRARLPRSVVCPGEVGYSGPVRRLPSGA